MAVLKTALAYFVIVLGFGFALGTLRTLWLAPALGANAAVILELPFMLAISWFTSLKLLRRWHHFPSMHQRAAIGFIALVMLLLAELALATLVFGQTSAAFRAALLQPAGLLGLAGQILFGIIPLLHRRAWRTSQIQ